jgi:prephenate dehydrogenase
MKENLEVNEIGIIGYGQFGSFVKDIINEKYPDIRVKVSSRSNRVDGETFFAFEEVCQANLIIPCIPISKFDTTIEQINFNIKEKRKPIIMEICTVKEYPLKVLNKFPQLKYISTHPMFGPNSYKKQNNKLDGLRIVICKHNLEKTEYSEMHNHLQKLGLNVIQITAQKHDKMLAKTLFLTHLISQTIIHGNYRRTEIDTLSFSYLMDAVESLQNDQELFKEVYQYNHHCKEVVNNLSQSLIEVVKIVDNKNPN